MLILLVFPIKFGLNFAGHFVVEHVVEVEHILSQT